MDCYSEKARILVVDDEPCVSRFLGRALRSAGYKSVQVFTDPVAAAEYLADEEADLVTLDICMPGLDGYGFLEVLREKTAISRKFLPVLAISALDDFEARERAIKAGAKAFMVKPVEVRDFLLQVYSLLDTCFLEQHLREDMAKLEDQVQTTASELKEAQSEVIERLARVAELRDDATGKHTYRVGRLSALIAQELGLSSHDVELILRAAPLHDIGKVSIEDQVLLKRGCFSQKEREIMQKHATRGSALLSGSKSELMKMAEQIAACHHERWDGYGYPKGLRGKEIPLPARIVALADTFDALINRRPYKDAWGLQDAITEIELEREGQFDPLVVDAFLRVVQTGLASPPMAAISS